MARIFITGSADGLGYMAADSLLDAGHDVVVHVRNRQRRAAVEDLITRGADVVIGDLGSDDETRAVAAAVNELGRMDAVIHNAGVVSGPIMTVNVVASWLLTALIERPDRLVYLSSGSHYGGSADPADIDWAGTRAGSYADSKLFITALTLALARRWPNVVSSAVDPGWVATKMGGASAPDDLELGHVTQEWLATSDDPEALVSGGYWFHQELHTPHDAAADEAFQDRLVEQLAAATGVTLA